MTGRFQDQESVIEQYAKPNALEARLRLNRAYTVEHSPFSRWVFQYLRLERGMSVLEIGCGTGALWDENRDQMPGDIEMTITDRSEGMVAKAKETLISAPFAARFMTADALALPFEDEVFDRVVANHVLHHLDDLDRALKEMKRVLKPGGVIIVTAIDPNGIQYFLDLTVGVERPAVEPIPFHMDNGLAILKPLFAQVEDFRREAYLSVPEADPLVEYIASMRFFTDGPRDFLEETRKSLIGRIQSDGPIIIPRRVALFRAMK